MKKLLLSFVALVATVAMNATDPVVIDFTTNPNKLTEALQAADISVYSSDSTVCVRMTQNTSTTVPILSLDMMKVYKNAKIEITSKSANIKSITFVTSGSSYGSDGFTTVSAGTLTGDEWAGDAASVSFTAAGHQVRLSKITVRFEDYVPPVVTVDTIGVTEARARIDAGTLGKCYVKGIVTKVDDSYISQYSNVNCWMTDITNTGDTLEGYKMKGANNTSYTSASNVEYAAGDTVLFYASALKNYNSTYEINEGYFVKVLGAGNGHVTIDTIDVTAAEAYQIGLNMEDSLSTNYYRMKTYVAKIKTAYSAQYNNITFYVNDTVGETYGDLQIFRAKPINKVDSTLMVGDGVEIVGKLSKYVGTYTSIEIVSGYYTILSHTGLNDVAAEPGKAVKFFENGKLYILKGGVKYDAKGQVVE